MRGGTPPNVHKFQLSAWQKQSLGVVEDGLKFLFSERNRTPLTQNFKNTFQEHLLCKAPQGDCLWLGLITLKNRDFSLRVFSAESHSKRFSSTCLLSSNIAQIGFRDSNFWFLNSVTVKDFSKPKTAKL